MREKEKATLSIIRIADIVLVKRQTNKNLKSSKNSAIIYIESEKRKNKFLLIKNKSNLIGATRLTVEKEEIL